MAQDEQQEAGGEGSPHLQESEQQTADEHAPLRPKVIHEIINEEGKAELDRDIGAFFWSGLAAGLSMGFSFLTQALLRTGLPDAPWRSLVDSFGYSMGFVIVIMGRQQLFTESTLTAVLPVLTERKMATIVKCLRLWAVVLVANLIGTVIFSGVLAWTHLFKPDVAHTFGEMAKEPYAATFAVTFGKAVFAGWIIALTVWLLPSAQAARPFIILGLTYLVALAHLSHIIAGSVEASYGAWIGQASWIDYIGVFVLPTMIGNTVGGVALVALLNHAPIASELQGGGEAQG